MFKENYNVLGVMSGTSLDGIDIARVELTKDTSKWNFKINEAATIPYTSTWVKKLKNAINYSEEQLFQLNKEYTHLLGSVISEFIIEHKLTNLDAICSHGHTILHQPHQGFTLQIGNLPEIFSLLKIPVVCDFRVQDVQLGGQGAPLVPIGDRLLFSEFEYCLNLGGFSNISFEQDNNRIAFDISPVNTVLNYFASLEGLDYDDKGNLARNGSLIKPLLEVLNNIDYYKKQPPKSLGIEFVESVIHPILKKHQDTSANLSHTFVEHIAFQISNAILKNKGNLLISGGGAFHTYLIERIIHYLPDLTIVIPDKRTIEYKEALIFALLGVLRLRNEINVLCSVTGAKHDHCSGVVYK